MTTLNPTQIYYLLHPVFRAALLPLLFLCSFTIQADVSENERKALLTLIDFAEDSVLYEKWSDSHDSVCFWQRVTCDNEQQHIIKLDLSHIDFRSNKKQITPKISKQLSALQKLDMSGNGFTSIPAEIGQLKALISLKLEGNQLKSLPPEIGQLNQLEKLNLNYNLLTQLPIELEKLKHLKALYLNSNKVTKIPKKIIRLPNLKDLKFQANWKLPAYNPNLISQETDKIVRNIQEKGYLEGEEIGCIFIHNTGQYDNLIKLKESASKIELLQLVNHINPVVRGYAFLALSTHKNTNLLPIIMAHLNDNEFAVESFNCRYRAIRLGEFIVDVIIPNSRYPRATFPLKKLSQQQLKALDQRLINLPSNFIFYTQDEALLRIEPDLKLYSRIRSLWVKEKKPAALVALAKYHKKQDIPLIIDSFSNPVGYGAGYWRPTSYTYQAVDVFPHPKFFPFLKLHLLEHIKDESSHFHSIFIEELYTAIARYQNKEALSLMTVTASKRLKKPEKTNHYQTKFCALKKVSIPFYEPVFWKIWAEKYIVTPDVLSYLLEQNPDKALSITKDTLQNIKTFDLNNLLSCSWSDLRKTTGSFLDIVLRKETEFAYKVIINNILNNDSTLFPVFINKAVNLKDTAFIQPLVQRLKTETKNYRHFVLLIRSLFSYNNPELTKRVNNIIDKKLASSFSHIKKEKLLKHLNDLEFII